MHTAVSAWALDVHDGLRVRHGQAWGKHTLTLVSVSMHAW